jgi:hypothetical protein
MLPAAMFFWRFFPLSAPMFVSYGRLHLPLAICTSVVAGNLVLVYAKNEKHKIIIYLLLLFTVGSTILNWGHRTVIPQINDQVLQMGVWKSTVTEGVTAYFLNNKWADINHFWFTQLPKEHTEILKGKGEVREVSRNSVKHTYVVNAITPMVIQENTLYFPGWHILSNGKEVQIYPGKRGIINAKIPQGLQYLDVYYEDIPFYKYSKLCSISILSLMIISMLYLLLPWRIKKIRKRK